MSQDDNKFLPDESFRDRMVTIDEDGNRKWIYATKPKGKFYNYRTYVSYLFFAILVVLPFIKVRGNPLFLLDVLNTRFIIFGKIFWPQDFFIFGLGMIAFIVIIILFTAAFGRLFCGWVCPQTIFMEMLFRKIEYAIEGDAPKQKRLNDGPWTNEKILKKTAKHVIFFALSFFISNLFLAYIIGVDELKLIIFDSISNHIGGFTAILVFSFIFYGVFAWFREQVCTVVCPYGRLQGVLLDQNSMVVAYDYQRGEPRGKVKDKDILNLGDCIDCNLCVKVCPTGIDIRNGTQMECVGCTACIDACDEIMEKVNRPLGLIRYASENGILNNEPLRYTPRMKLYTLLLIALVALLSILLITRKDVDATIIRAQGMLYQEVGTDSLSNLYTIKMVNKTIKNLNVSLKLEGIPGQIKMAGDKDIPVHKEGQGSGSFFIILPKNQVKDRKTEVNIGIYSNGERIDVLSTNFMGPIHVN